MLKIYFNHKYLVFNNLCVLFILFLLISCQNNLSQPNKALPVKDSVEAARLYKETKRLQFEQPDSALVAALARKRIFERNDNSIGIMEYYVKASHIYCMIKQDINTGKKYADSAWLLSQQSGNEHLLYKAYLSRGIYYYYQPNNDSAIQYMLKALQIQPSTRDTNFYEIAHAYVADLYASQGNYASALNYYRPLIEVAQSGEKKMNVLTYSNAASYAMELPDKDSLARSYLSAATATAHRFQYNTFNFVLYTYWAEYYKKRKQFDSSNLYAYKAIAINKTAPQTFDRIERAYIMLLENYIAQHQYKKAKQELIAAKEKSDTASMLLCDKEDLLEIEYKIEKEIGSTAKALNIFEVLYNLKVEAFKNAKTTQLLNHEKELKKLAAENIIKDKDLTIKKQQLFSIVTGFISLLFLIIMLFTYLYLRKRKHLEIIQRQQLQRTAELEKEHALLQFQIEERNRIAQEMHDHLGSTLTTVQMGLVLLEQEPSNRDHLNMIGRATDTMSNQMNEVIWNLNVRNDHLHSLLDYFTRYANDFLGNAGIHLQLDISEIHKDHPISGKWRRGVYLTLKELLNNIVKYAQAKNVVIKFEVNDLMMMKIVLRDDGVGINHRQSINSNKGQGLHNIKHTIEQLKGNIHWHEDNGTETIIYLPIQ